MTPSIEVIRTCSKKNTWLEITTALGLPATDGG
jgi:phenylalanyl-tRNA synthetase alpha subunit